MYKLMALITLLMLTLSSPAYCRKFKVRSVEHPSRKAVLVDNDTGEEWLVGEGDSMEGWIVRKIGPTHIILFHQIDEHRGEKVMVPAVPMVEEAIPTR
ncbi:hypothetical protein [Desulforhabdus amnigena]|jgi:hypothetical protein|uniref:Uncharacterized protein n=1 Tax=Desulforhabdus amnigena TaxID=40218 RepID=A0A9W6FU47_9BACT|nr:hypothetical protein [Desulforhabdus amnigena]NLJ28745.1 hypothetical protein [Deltaproteobacteria bacterium]GLI34907.1 hypothetical protein DAMNIGENAA_23400 [Desulforhabdus amnigena]